MLQSLLVIGAAALGIHRAHVLVRDYPDITLTTALSRRPTLGLSALLGFVAAGALLAFGIRPMLLWGPPLWVQRLARPAMWGTLIGAIAYLAALCAHLAFRSGHGERKKLAVLGLLLVAMIEAGQIALTWPIGDELRRRQAKRGWVMETSYYTCAAAVGATIAHDLGIPAPTEKSLAQSMGSSMSSTTPADFIDAMGALGIRCAQRDVPGEDLLQVRPPALLFIDQVEDGPEGHAAAVLGFANGDAEIWDPRKGHYSISAADYAYWWHGRAIECGSLVAGVTPARQPAPMTSP